MEGAVEGVCKTRFEKQNRGLLLDFGGWVLSLFCSQFFCTLKFKPCTRDTLTHIQAQLHEMAFISMLIWLFDLQTHTDGSRFMRCQKKGFGGIKGEVRKGYHPTARTVESHPACTEFSSTGNFASRPEITPRLLKRRQNLRSEPVKHSHTDEKKKNPMLWNNTNK